MNEVLKGKMIEGLTKDASEAYGRIIKRYPAMNRALDAKARLEALDQPVPRPTRAALELNKKEEASRQQTSTMSNMLGTFEKHPDVAKTVRLGEPTMVDAAPVTATDVVRRVTQSGMGGDNKVSAETVNGTVGSEPGGAAFGFSNGNSNARLVGSTRRRPACGARAGGSGVEAEGVWRIRTN